MIDDLINFFIPLLVGVVSGAVLIIIFLVLNGNLQMECDKIPGKKDFCKIVLKVNK